MVIKGKSLLEVLDKDESTQCVSLGLEGKIKNAQEPPRSISEASSRSQFFQPSTPFSFSSSSNQSEEKPAKKAKHDSLWSR
ncbi:hypothetical protein [Coxiella endosymbiont of Ornithodoros maritimus]|uniref:hypothetical protein n=1 Tax=Coxiella endosymbiont of Ornithodoros maritimus TaxID=1656172 RepID=UPI002265189D|nr:hypothetical protein [Coxiella endosymbiont of Ornithodoros maritimus]